MTTTTPCTAVRDCTTIQRYGDGDYRVNHRVTLHGAVDRERSGWIDGPVFVGVNPRSENRPWLVYVRSFPAPRPPVWIIEARYLDSGKVTRPAEARDTEWLCYYDAVVALRELAATREWPEITRLR